MLQPVGSMQQTRLASVNNFRDVAGSPGLRTADGGRLRPAVLYRSSELQPDPADTLTLTGLGLRAIHDLRDPDEVAAHPDAVLPGATWESFPVPGIPVDEVLELPDEAAAIAMMERMYRGFVEDPGARSSLGAMFRRIADTDGPQLIHCTSGRDRTGWVVALLLHLAEVPEEQILADYLATDEGARATRAWYVTLVESGRGPAMVPVFERVLTADEEYLATSYLAVARSYGSIETYLSAGLGLGEQTLVRLRGLLRG